MENFDRIQQYLFNTMTKEERAALEKEFRDDKDLAKELELQRFEMETIDQLEEDTLREKAKILKSNRDDRKTDSDNVKPIRRNLIRRFSVLSIAASIALIAGYFFLTPKDMLSIDYISYGYAEARLNYGNQLLKSSEGKAPIFNMGYIEILKNQDKTKAKEAIQYFESFSSESSSNKLQAQLNLGHAYILGEQYNKALQVFSLIELSNDASPQQVEEAMLFKAISSIALGEKGEAVSILEDLSVNGQSFEVLAKNLLKKID